MIVPVIVLILQELLLLLQLLGIELFIAAISSRPAILLLDRLDAWAHTGQLIVRKVGHGLDLQLFSRSTIGTFLTHVPLMYEVIVEALGLRLLYFNHFSHLALTSLCKVENVSLCIILLGLR